MNKSHTITIKGIIDKSYESACFLVHTRNINQIDMNMKSRFMLMRLPPTLTTDDTIDIAYKRIIALVHHSLTKETIETIREICYMYYMNHTSSVELQQKIVKEVGASLVLPNDIKCELVRDIVDVNRMYGYSYRKPLYLECMIYSMCNRLEHYTV